MREAFGVISTDWKKGINWATVRDYRLKRAHEAMNARVTGPFLEANSEYGRRAIDR